METSMTTGIEFKIATMAGKCLLLPMLVWFFYPIYDAIVLFMIDDYALLSPFAKNLIEDFKLILGAIVALLVTIKLVLGIVKTRKEIKEINEKRNDTKNTK